jgi:hypothetical protein
VLRAVETFRQRLAILAHLLASGDEATLRHTLHAIRATRKEMFP